MFFLMLFKHYFMSDGDVITDISSAEAANAKVRVSTHSIRIGIDLDALGFIVAALFRSEGYARNHSYLKKHEK